MNKYPKTMAGCDVDENGILYYPVGHEYHGFATGFTVESLNGAVDQLAARIEDEVLNELVSRFPA